MSGSNDEARALRVMVEELRAEPTPELDWEKVERKLLAEVHRSETARQQRAAVLASASAGKAFAFAAAAALIVLGIGNVAGSGDARPAPVAEAPVAVNAEQLAHAPGEAGARGELDAATLRVGDVVATDDTPVTFRRDGVAAWTLAPASLVEVRAAGDKRGVGQTVALLRGSLRAEVVPRDASEGMVEAFAVEVERTRVAVHGTVFSVIREEAGVIVDVEHGTVAVGPAGNAGVTTGHLLVGPTRASFSLDGGKTARFIPRAPEAPAMAIAAAAPAEAPAAAQLPIVAGLDPAPAAPGARVAPALHGAPDAPAPDAIAKVAPVEPAGPAAVAPPAAALTEAVVTSRMRQCFARVYAGDVGSPVDISVTSTLHLALREDGSVKSAIFNPPLSPEFMSCAGGAIGGRFAEGNRQLDLPMSFRSR